MLLLGLCVVLAAAGASGAPAPAAVTASVEPARPTVFAKNVLELRLRALVAPTATLQRCMVRVPGVDKQFVALTKETSGRLSLLGDCGVRVRDANVTTDDGEWTLSAEYDAATATASATVQVLDFAAGVLPVLPSVDEGASLRLRLVATKAPRPLKKCVVYPPRGGSVPLDPAAKEGRVRYDADGGDLASGWCGVRVEPVQALDQGAWVLEAVVVEDGVVYRGKTSVTVYRPKVLVLPSGPVYAEVQDEVTLTLQFQKPPAQDPVWRVCTVRRPDGTVVQVAGEAAVDSTGAAVLDPSSNLAKGKCTVRVTLASSDTGFWTLSAGPDEDSLRSAQVRIYVNGPYVAVGGTLKMTVGDQKATVTCGPRADVLACELWDPSGHLAVALDGPCEYTLSRVRDDHRGKWTCSAVMAGYTKAVKDYVTLELEDPAHAETGVVRDSAGVTLRCVVRDCGGWTGGAGYCRMVAPDGASVMLKEAVSRQGEYSYAGEGFAKCDCSMRIAGAPRDHHYGVWRCYIGDPARPKSRPRGGLIRLVKQDARSARSGDAATDVVAFTVPATGLVPPGGRMTVGCRAQAALSYCFLRTPLGQQLLLNERTALYSGAGLPFGDCALQMAMTANLSGTWQCGVGVAGGPAPFLDVEVPVQVTVSESLAMAVQSNVTASPGSKNVTLACRTVLGEAIQYCRFHRPDGVSIHLADAQHAQQPATGAADFPYRYADGSLRRGDCGVAIEAVSEVDVGPWTCVVALVGVTAGTEHTATIMLHLGDQGAGVDAALSGMAAALATLVLAVAGFLVYRRYFRPPLAASHESIPLSEPGSTPSSPGGVLRASPSAARTRSRVRTATSRRVTSRILGAPMQTSHLPARTTRTRSARKGTQQEQAEVGQASLSDSSVEAEYGPEAAKSR